MTDSPDKPLTLSVERWCLWQARPDGSARVIEASPSGRRAYAADRPALADIPPLQRRRLSPLARVSFHCLGHCVDTGAQEPLVFSSAMGELRRTQSLLQSIAENEALSPAAFSLSVHNAIGGLWSQIKGLRAPITALAPVNCSPVAALLEAAGQLGEGVNAVNVVYAEESYPAFYAPWLSSPPGPSALALRLSLPPRPALAHLQLQALAAQQRAGDAQHNATALPGLLTGEHSSVTISEGNCHWQLECY